MEISPACPRASRVSPLCAGRRGGEGGRGAQETKGGRDGSVKITSREERAIRIYIYIYVYSVVLVLSCLARNERGRAGANNEKGCAREKISITIYYDLCSAHTSDTHRNDPNRIYSRG